ncbi:hypothetical protein roselon_00749 [Roseibacterium elongatum DSM 19469]|uniref:Uncharacterized protein n=1 Tax=Roseicyclus elongatus DSM 19469 TaxID=1294273 RepID=W8RQ37_9RHOB|nr:hypothetical protein [Roseibacterium elongatum]AHM03168.1 hypothetical protein roselon_00749 [Roseibacterium elongatum DSM 19469]
MAVAEGEAADGEATETAAAEGEAAEGDATETAAAEGEAADGEATETAAAEGEAAEGDVTDPAAIAAVAAELENLDLPSEVEIYLLRRLSEAAGRAAEQAQIAREANAAVAEADDEINALMQELMELREASPEAE